MEDETFKVRGSAATRQISATYAHSEGAAMQIVLQLSACHPLRALEVGRVHNPNPNPNLTPIPHPNLMPIPKPNLTKVECVQRVGVSDARWRKWQRTISTMLLAQNGAISEALLLWRQHVDKVVEGTPNPNPNPNPNRNPIPNPIPIPNPNPD